jgi:8-oxo-dGTP pyrophosphatase MutT (NUDIX family)
MARSPALDRFLELAAQRLLPSPPPGSDVNDDAAHGAIHGDHAFSPNLEAEFPAGAGKPAAVLIPIVDRSEGPTVLFTQRSGALRSHSGQIAFPGGRIDPGDDGPLGAALREAEEEIGLEPGDVELIGALQPTPTIATNYAVYPFVGLIEPGRSWRPSAAEVAEVLELPLHGLRAGYARRRLLRRGVPFRTDVYCVDQHLIWGATARIVADLLERVPDDLQ